MISIETWAENYQAKEETEMRGGRRPKDRKRILQDLKAANGVAFPTVSILTLIWWVFKIWMALR